MRWVHLGLPVVTALIYGLLVFGFTPILTVQGLPPFDLRIAGYGKEEARAYLAALTPEARAAYLGPERIVDTIFPLLMGLTLCLPLYRRGGIWPLPAALYTLIDLAENAAVAVLLREGADNAGAVRIASLLTQAKFAAFVLAAVLALWVLWRRTGR